MRLSEKAEEILERMWVLIEEEGRGFVDADQLGLPDNDEAISELVSQTLVERRDGRIYFRPEGREEGRTTIRRHRLAERLMMDVLDIRGENAEEKACQFEHLLNQGVDTKICTMLNHPRTCPHGKPIPPGDCCREAEAAGDMGVVPLTELKPGDEGEIAYLQTDDGRTMQKLMAMGVLPGSRIQLAGSFPSYIFRVGYSEFAIDSSLAREIIVRRS